MLLKIVNTLLILFSLYMGLKQGWAMLSGKPHMLDMFSKWPIGRTGIAILGVCTIAGALMVLSPKTFIYGNFITAAGILLIIAFQLSDRNLKGAAIELPFLFLSLLIIYLQYPFPELFKSSR